MNLIKTFIRYIIHVLQKAVRPLFRHSSFLSRLYYLLFDQGFAFEQQAVLKGQVCYWAESGLQGTSSAFLRRNIHRLEKGLIMRPRRAIFAVDYIGETLHIYALALKKTGFCQSELHWATSILIEYFSVVEVTSVELVEHFKFFKSLDITDYGTEIVKPYSSEQRTKHSVNYEALFDLACARRSTRWFKDTPIPKELLLQAAALASQAPSACNRQAYEFMCIDHQPLLSKVLTLPGGVAGFAGNIPTLIAVVGDLSAYPEVRDRHAIYIDSSLASMQFMLACETLGLATCAINWPELKQLDKRLTKLLNLPQYKRVVMFMAVGFPLPDGGIPYSSKKTADQLLTFISSERT